MSTFRVKTLIDVSVNTSIPVTFLQLVARNLCSVNINQYEMLVLKINKGG